MSSLFVFLVFTILSLYVSVCMLYHTVMAPNTLPYERVYLIVVLCNSNHHLWDAKVMNSCFVFSSGIHTITSFFSLVSEFSFVINNILFISLRPRLFDTSFKWEPIQSLRLSVERSVRNGEWFVQFCRIRSAHAVVWHRCCVC